MAKVHVGGSIAHAYSFVLKRFISIIGLCWLPATFLAVLLSWWLTRLSAGALLIATGTGTGPRMIGETLVLLLVALLLVSAIAVPLSRIALGEDVDGAAARFAVGARELRLFLALIRFGVVAAAALLILAVGLAALIESGLVHAMARALPGTKHYSSELGDLWRGLPVNTIVIGGGTAFSAAIFGVLAVRLAIFLLPIAASERHASLSRAAALSRGNTWRLLIISVALLIPVTALLAAGEFTVLGPPVRANLQRVLTAGMPDRALEILALHAPQVGAVASATIVTLLALIAGSSAVAYADRRDDVPLKTRAPARHRKKSDTREVPAPLVGVGQVPAFAKVHPLATLLPSEMPLTEAHQAGSAEAPAGGQVTASAESRETEVEPPTTADGEHDTSARAPQRVFAGHVLDQNSLAPAEAEVAAAFASERGDYESESDPSAADAPDQAFASERTGTVR